MLKRSLNLSAGAFLMAGLIIIAHADVQRGLEAAKQHRYGVAFNEFRKDAKTGNPRAQALLANMYRSGYGVATNLEKAFYWYQKAAEQGDAKSQYNLALCYQQGIGTEADAALAFQWYKNAAQQDFVPALINLAVYHANGEAVPADPILADAWLHLAIGLGSTLALDMQEELEKDMTDEEILNAKSVAKSLYENEIDDPVMPITGTPETRNAGPRANQ